MRISALAAFGVIFLPVVASAGLITTVYDASLGTLPEAQGFTAHVELAHNPQITGGVLDVNAYDTGVDSLPGFYQRANGTFLFSSFVMESRLRIVDATQRNGPGQGNYPRGGFILGATDDNGLDLELEFGPGGVWLQTSDGVAATPPASSFFSLDTSEFHTYRVQTNGTDAALYLDGAATAALSMPLNTLQVSGGTPSEVLFGDASFLTRAHFQTQYFLFSSDTDAGVPEPGTLSMFGIAAAGLLLARYRAAR